MECLAIWGAAKRTVDQTVDSSGDDGVSLQETCLLNVCCCLA